MTIQLRIFFEVFCISQCLVWWVRVRVEENVGFSKLLRSKYKGNKVRAKAIIASLCNSDIN